MSAAGEDGLARAPLARGAAEAGGGAGGGIDPLDGVRVEEPPDAGTVRIRERSRPSARTRRIALLALLLRARLRDPDPELLLEPDIALRPDPLALQRRHHDRRLSAEHGRQGPVQGALVLRPRARAGAVRAALGTASLHAVDAEALALKSQAQRSADEMVYLIGLWGNVLPGLLLLLLVWRVAERYEPGYGAAAAVIARARHDGPAALDAAVLARLHRLPRLRRVRADAARARRTPRPLLLAPRRPAMGYAVASEYPLFFVALVLGLYLLSKPGALTPRLLSMRAGAYILGGLDRDRPAAALQPRRVPLLDAPRLLRRPPSAERLLRDLRAQPARAGHAAVRLPRAAHDLPRADHGGDRHSAPVPPRQAGRGADDRGHLRLLPGLQLGLLPALRRRLHGPALPGHDAAVPRFPDRARPAAASRAPRSRWRGRRSRRP